MGPHGGGGVGEAALGKGVGCEQEAEVVGDERERDGAEGKNGKAQQEGCEAYGGNGQALTAGQSCEGAFDARIQAGGEVWEGEWDGECDYREAGFDQHQRHVIFGC